MTDRDLLELAAKAAEYHEIEGWALDTAHGMRWVDDNHEWIKWWNPLTNDGDALRLAVKLKLLVDICSDQSEAGNSWCPYQCELHFGDPYAATRRAIVRAAAEIGKSLLTKELYAH